MGRISRPKLVNLLRRDKESYKMLFRRSKKNAQQPNRRPLKTKDITGGRKPIRRPKRPNRLRRRRMTCEIQFPTTGHRRKVFGKTLQQFGVYDEIVKRR